MITFKTSKELNAATGKIMLDVDLEIKKGEFIALYGPSGSGKTTLLRILSGLDKPDLGYIKTDNHVWLDIENKINVIPQKRNIGFVFQHYALFPNMTVRENLLYALPQKHNEKIIEELLELMELSQLQHQDINILSGGQKQRVALARSLVQQAEILLLDEPFAALDNARRSKIQDYILKIHQQLNLTTILVSHDISEIYKMADTVLVIENGKIIKEGSPQEVFTNKKTSENIEVIAEILEIKKMGSNCIISILIGKTITEISKSENEVKELRLGDKISISLQSYQATINKL